MLDKYTRGVVCLPSAACLHGAGRQHPPRPSSRNQPFRRPPAPAHTRPVRRQRIDFPSEPNQTCCGADPNSGRQSGQCCCGCEGEERRSVKVRTTQAGKVLREEEIKEGTGRIGHHKHLIIWATCEQRPKRHSSRLKRGGLHSVTWLKSQLSCPRF